MPDREKSLLTNRNITFTSPTWVPVTSLLMKRLRLWVPKTLISHPSLAPSQVSTFISDTGYFTSCSYLSAILLKKFLQDFFLTFVALQEQISSWIQHQLHRLQCLGSWCHCCTQDWQYLGFCCCWSGQHQKSVLQTIGSHSTFFQSQTHEETHARVRASDSYLFIWSVCWIQRESDWPF